MSDYMESLNIYSNNCYTYTGSVLSLMRRNIMQDNQSQTHWIYTAGIMDSDGCFMIAKSKRKHDRADYIPQVKIVMITNRAINYIQESTNLGKISIIGTRPSRPKTLPLYEWRITNRANLMVFLKGIIPYLKNKQDRAEHLLRYCESIGFREYGQRHIRIPKEELDYREESYRKMREFNGNKVGAETKPHGHESACDSPNS